MGQQSLLLISFCFFASVVLCREAPLEGLAVLDVAASVQRTIDVLSFPQNGTVLPQQEELEQEQGLGPSDVLSLPLLPRIALRGTTHADYRSLVLSRLRRDAARVRSIAAAVQLAAAGVSKSGLRPQQQQEEEIFWDQKSLQTPVVSGIRYGSGEYFGRVGFGTPAKELYVVLDTGSNLNWIQCEPCSSCYRQADPIFDPRASSTYARVGCQAQQCGAYSQTACSRGVCQYQVNYGDGSYTVGDLATETLSFGSSGTVPGVAVGCGHDNEGLFAGSAGLMGLGRGPLSLPSQVKARGFSYCLVDRDSAASSTLDFDPAPPVGAITTPLLGSGRAGGAAGTFYYVGLAGLRVGQNALSIPPSAFDMDAATGEGGVIVDSGTSVTRLPAQAYAALRAAFRQGTGGLRSAGGFSLFDTCYDLSGMQTVKVPTVALRFAGGKELPLPAKNYLVPVDSAGTFCLAFAPTTSSPAIIGNVQQQGTRVTFDVGNMLVGFSPNKC